MDSQISTDALRSVATEFGEVFVIPASTGTLLRPIREIMASKSSPLNEIAEAYCTSVESIVATAGIPYFLGAATSHRRSYDLLYYAERISMIRLGIHTAEGTSDTTADPSREAHRRVQEFSESSEYGDRINYDTCSFLLKLAQDGTVREAITQLHLQVAVLIWGAFEVASRELFRAHLNRNPTAYTNLLQDSDVRKRFELTRVSLERVAEFNFDLSSRLGDLLLEHNDLADLATIRAGFSALFPVDSAVRESLTEEDLWRLFQRRNLIVHRQGTVDLRYRELTGDEQALGVRLVLRPRDLERYLTITTTAMQNILSAVVNSRGDTTS